MLACFTDHWSPKKIAQINDYEVRIGLVSPNWPRREGGLVWPRLECQVMNAVIRIETSSPGSSTPSLAT